jgi:hypothetical protein
VVVVGGTIDVQGGRLKLNGGGTSTGGLPLVWQVAGRGRGTDPSGCNSPNGSRAGASAVRVKPAQSWRHATGVGGTLEERACAARVPRHVVRVARPAPSGCGGKFEEPQILDAASREPDSS